MCGDNVTVHVIGRMLNRGKFFNVPSNGKYNDTSRVLSCGSPHSGTALHDPVDLTVSLPLSTFFIVVLHISKSCFFSQGTDGSCLKGLSCTENNLDIPVCFSLIVTGKVQVNIRLLISFKSKERLKGNIKPFFYKGFSAHRTVFIRHITSGSSGILPNLRGIKIRIMTFSTIVMRT